MVKEQIRTVIEDDDGNITVWNFREEADAEAFMLGHFEEVMKSWDIDYYTETGLDQGDIDSLNFYVDNYSIYVTKSSLLYKNPRGNDGTKKFRANTERSRQEDRTTPGDGGEA